MKIKKTYEEINQKIKKGKAVVVTAEEMPKIVSTEGVKKAFQKVDVVTTGTFGTMCSSGAFFNIPHAKPKIKISKLWFNEVEAYAGLAAMDSYLGAAQVQENNPLNLVFPGEFNYGGGHVLEDLIAGKEITVKAQAYGTNCYPSKEHFWKLKLNDFNQAILYNPRNAYQNYNCAVNLSKKIIYTYMGILKPEMANATYSSAGQLSPLFNDPYYWTIGTGTKIFLGGAVGAVTWQGTQHDPKAKRDKNGIPLGGAGTMAVMGDMKKMKAEFIRGASLVGYGTSLMVGIGVPIPILNEDLAFFTGLSDQDLSCPVVDYSYDYPQAVNKKLAQVSYADLKSGQIKVKGKIIPTSPLSSYPMAKKISLSLKKWVENGFTLGEPQINFSTVPLKRENELSK